MGRAPCCDKANVKKGSWSPDEDEKLKTYIEENGTGGNWIALPQKIGLKRCGKSCRLRWLNYLRPNIKHGGFSEEEDQIICNLFITIGSKWSIIASQLPGRTDNDIKNYWNTRLKKKLLNWQRGSSSTSYFLHHSNEKVCNTKPNPNGSLKTFATSSQETLQLHMQMQGLHSPFTFYNNTPLWSKLSSLENECKAFQDLSTDTTTSTMYPLKLSQQAKELTEQTNIKNSLHANFQESLGVSSPSSFDLDIGLHHLIFGTEIQLFSGIDSCKELNFEEETNWRGSIGIDEKSLPSLSDLALALQPDSMLHEYRIGYDL